MEVFVRLVRFVAMLIGKVTYFWCIHVANGLPFELGKQTFAHIFLQTLILEIYARSKHPQSGDLEAKKVLQNRKDKFEALFFAARDGFFIGGMTEVALSALQPGSGVLKGH